jgi:hypothetical protein
MHATRGSWAFVEVGGYIRDKNNVTWRVERLSADRAVLVDRAGRTVEIERPPAERHVTMLEPTEEEARYTLAKALGARVVSVTEHTEEP